MAKQVLGRNLEALLDGKPKDPAKAGSSVPPTAPVSSGVRSLMRGNQPKVESAPEIESNRKPAIPRWYLFGGDVLLGALALIIVCKSPHPLSWQRELFCAAAVILGGCLAVAAISSKE